MIKAYPFYYYLTPDGTIHMIDLVFSNGVHVFYGKCGGVWHPRITENWQAITEASTWPPDAEICPNCDRVRQDLLAYLSKPEE